MRKNEEAETQLEMLSQWLEEKEGEHVEFKEARANYSFEELAKYCCALANEGGGKIILGVTDKRPRKVVGTNVYTQPENTLRSLAEQLHLRVDYLTFNHPGGRVLAFIIPPRPFGVPVKYKGIYWARETDSLVPMSEEKLKEIIFETGHDFSADICPGATIDALSNEAIEVFRRRWIDKSGNKNISSISHEQLLRDAELLIDGGVTFAALILFAKKEAMGRYLGQAEVIFEYRSTDSSGPAQQRVEFRQGFFEYYETLWSLINQRNDFQHYQEGLFVKDIQTFPERSVREAVLNAVSHRNYQLGGSVFIRQFPKRLVVESPGGLPTGITLDNILDRQSPKNRRLADAFAKCGLVERSGQGMNLMFEQAIKQGQNKPDFTGTDQYLVVITLQGQVQDLSFVRFLERIGQETIAVFNTHDFLVMDLVHHDEKIRPDLLANVKKLINFGVIEKVGKRYVLAKRYYSMVGRKGVYTRRKGLDRDTNKQLLLKHITENNSDGCKMAELQQVLPGQGRSQIQVLLRELRSSGQIHCIGHTSAGKWFAGKPKSDLQQ